MDYEIIVTVLASVLTSLLALWGVFTRVRAKERADTLAHEAALNKSIREEHNNFRDEIHREVELLRTRNHELQAKNEELIREISTLTGKFLALEANLNLKIALYESAHQDLPLPMWLKDETGRVLAINPSYESTFLTPRGYVMSDYLRHTDDNVWPKETAEEFRRNDQRVYATGETWIGREGVPDEYGNVIQWRIIKYVRWAGPVKLGIAGIAFPEIIEDIEHK